MNLHAHIRQIILIRVIIWGFLPLPLLDTFLLDVLSRLHAEIIHLPSSYVGNYIKLVSKNCMSHESPSPWLNLVKHHPFTVWKCLHLWFDGPVICSLCLLPLSVIISLLKHQSAKLKMHCQVCQTFHFLTRTQWMTEIYCSSPFQDVPYAFQVVQ